MSIRRLVFVLGVLVAGLSAGETPPVYDPVVDVLNTGTVLEVQPLVSADRKYITMGGIRASQARLAGTFIEEIRTLGAEPVSNRVQALLATAWTGNLVAAGADSTTGIPIALDLTGTVTGTVLHPVIAAKVVQSDQIHRQVHLQLIVRLPGEPRRTALGRVHEDHLLRTLDCQFTADATWQHLSGPYSGGLGTGEMTLTRPACILPDILQGTWIGETRALTGALERGAGSSCNLTRDSAGIRLDLGGDRMVQATPLSWQDARRRLVLLVTFPADAGETPGPQGLLVGCFDQDLTRLGAWLSPGGPLEGPVLFARPVASLDPAK